MSIEAFLPMYVLTVVLCKSTEPFREGWENFLSTAFPAVFKQVRLIITVANSLNRFVFSVSYIVVIAEVELFP